MPAYVETEHRLEYDAPGPVTAAMLADSLLGLDGLAPHVARIVTQLTGVKVKDSAIYITSFETGSYKDSFLYRMVFGTGEDAEKKVEELRAKLGLNKMTPQHFINLALAAAVLWVGYQYATKSGNKEASVHIENSFNNWGKEVGMTPEEFKAAIHGAIKNVGDASKNVRRLTHPQGSEEVGELKIGGKGAAEFIVPRETIRAIPAKADDDEKAEPEEDRDNVQIVVRAIDLDRPAQGWHAIIAEISDKRLPIRLAPEVAPSTVEVGKFATADITVIYSVDRHGNKTPSRYLLRKIHPYVPPAATAAAEPSEPR